ncbi:MAG: aspartate carbamoyltransferase, partial [Candidatus Parcubacteria bacterium]|nr:aspartate carbamoyltransferase [Candidatus Parcubacteria bacterium]
MIFDICLNKGGFIMVEWWGEHDGIDFPHVVMSQQFEREHLERLFKLIRLLKENVPMGYMVDWLRGCNVAAMFWEPSTRTRLSFESAINRLGGHKVSSENAGDYSSTVKGETLPDTIGTILKFANIVVMRHKQEGAGHIAARRANKEALPYAIINGGDGKGQHPTQALLDLYTLFEKFGRIDGLKIAMVGDLLRGRTVRSLSYMLSKFRNVEIILVSSKYSRMNDDVKEHLTEQKVRWSEKDNLIDVVGSVDAYYMTREQLERENNPIKKWLMRRASLKLMMTWEVADKMKGDSIILHPLPRNKEIAVEVDDNVRAYYFPEVENGLYTRMALMAIIWSYLKPRLG